MREIVVDSDGDQPILQDETGLTSENSRRTHKKKCIKSEKVVTKTKSHFLAKPRELKGF